MPKNQRVQFERRKKEIEKKFKEEMGLIIDMSKPNYGTSNDGNTPRRFFSNPTLSAELSGKVFNTLMKQIIVRFVLKALMKI